MSEKEKEEKSDRTDAIEKRKKLMEKRRQMMERMGGGGGGGLSSLMSQMMSQRGMGSQRVQSALLKKMREIDQQLDRVEEKLDKLTS